MSTSQEPTWLNIITDLQLRRELQHSTVVNDFTGAIRTAFVHLEKRIRESAGLEDHLHGKDLIDKAFNPNDDILQPVSPDGGERAGLYNLLLGIFLYYRNPIAHRPINHDEETARPILSMINHALQLVDRAVEFAFNLRDFLGQHEGHVLQRRDYRLDIDELEIVALLELGAITDGTVVTPHLATVILKKGDRGYRRIPAEWVQGRSIYGPIDVVIRHITNPQTPDIVIYWAWGGKPKL